MKVGVEKLLAISEKIKTPLALSGLVILVLYLIFNRVLDLKVFSNIGSGNTFALLQTLLGYVFWLAIVAVVLGVGSYLAGIVLKDRNAASFSRVELIDARLDTKDSPYEEVEEEGRQVIKHRDKARRKQ